MVVSLVRYLEKLKVFKNLDLFNRQFAGWMSLDASRGCWGVALAPAVGGGKPRLLRHAGSDSAEGFAGVSRGVLAEIATPNFGLTCVLPASEYQLMLIERPAVKEDEMTQGLRWVLDARLEYPSAEANVAWFDVPLHESQVNKPRQLYVACARKAELDARTKTIEEAGAPLTAIDIRETARRNLAALVEEHTGNKGVFLLVAEDEGLQITVTYEGALYLERFIPEKLFERTEGQEPEARERQADRIALEIQRTLDFLRRNFAFVTVSEILIAPMIVPTGLTSALSSRLNEPVRDLDLSDHFEWSEGSPLREPPTQARYLTALGAALRYRDSVHA